MSSLLAARLRETRDAFAGWAKKLFGGEGGGPGLQNARPRHCADCAHARAGTAGAIRRWLAVGVAGTGLAAIGLIVVWLSFIAGLVCLLAGGLAAACAYLRVRRDVVQTRVVHAGTASSQGGRR